MINLNLSKRWNFRTDRRQHSHGEWFNLSMQDIQNVC